MTIWFIADTHFGEQPAKRQKASGMSAEELDDLIASRWRERVSVGDTVWHLGDIGKDWRKLAELPGIKHLIFGNGDERRRATLANSDLFASKADTHRLTVPSGHLYLIHIPENAPADQLPAEVVHGHHHHKQPKPGHRSVSVDRIDWAPISLEELMERDA